MRAWALKSRPAGTPVADNFQMIEATDAPLGEGEFRIANSWLSVDPYMRGRMNDVKSYAPPFGIGEAMTGGAVGTVVFSTTDGSEIDADQQAEVERKLAEGLAPQVPVSGTGA